MNKNDYCLTEKGNLITKSSYYLQEYLGTPPGALYHASIFFSEKFKEFLQTHDFEPVPDALWNDYLEIVQLGFDDTLDNCQAKEKLTEIENRGNIKKGIFEIICEE